MSSNVIQHNIQAAYASRNLNITNGKLGKSIERLSSGYRINRAADDASGLSISEKMRKQVRGLTQASMNAGDGISMVKIADGAISEVSEMIHRANELAIKAANGTCSDSDRQDMQAELDQIKEEIGQIAEKTKFNEINVLQGGSTEGVTDAHEDVVVINGLPSFVSIDSASLSNGYMSSTFTDSSGIEHCSASIDFSGFTGADSQKDELDGQGFYTTCCTCHAHYSVEFSNGSYSGTNPEIDDRHYIYHVNISSCSSGEDIVNAIRSVTGSNPNDHFTVFKASGSTLNIYDERPTNEAMAGPRSYYNNQIYGKIGAGVARDKRDYIMEKRAEGEADIILQIGADNREDNRLAVCLPNIDCPTCRLSNVFISNQNDAFEAIDQLDDALKFVTAERSRMGAYQNRLEHTVLNLDNVVENTSAAESRIRDTDMAKEMVIYSMYSILRQAGESMLTQANQSPQTVLQLLEGA